MTDTATAPAWAFEYCDPATLLVDANVRLDPRLDADFLASVKEHGVLIPAFAYRTTDGRIRVRDGHRRTLAAIQAGHVIPVLIAGDEAAGKDADIARIVEQYTVNTHRAGLTAPEQAAVVAALFDYGVPAAAIRRKTGLTREQTDAAQKAAASKKASAAAATHNLDLEQTAGLAEFEDDKDAFNALVKAAERGQFDHVLQQKRDSRAVAEMIAAHTATLEEQGVKVITGGQPYDHAVGYWTDGDGKPLTGAAHKKCPGHVVTLSVFGYEKRRVEESAYCTDPKKYGHKRYRGPGSGTSKPPGEQKRIREGNSAWRSARTVRRKWLREFLAMPKLPGPTTRNPVLQFVLEEFARADRRLRTAMDHRSAGQHVTARELLGITRPEGADYYDPPEVLTAMEAASPARAQVIGLALILGAYEANLYDDSWQRPSPENARYLKKLEQFGYPLSEIEQQMVAAVHKGEAEEAAAKAAAAAEKAATAAEDGRDIAAEDEATIDEEFAAEFAAEAASLDETGWPGEE